MRINKPQGFHISNPKCSFELVLAKLNSLYIHEEIIPEKMKELVEKIPHDGVWIHPIIVDVNSSVVLDGMHRVAAAKEIGYKYIPVCLVDYRNTNIKIGCWYRMFKALHPKDAEAALMDTGLRLSEGTYDDAERLVKKREAITAMFSTSWSIIAIGQVDSIKMRYELIKKIENALQSKGVNMGYSTDADAPSRITSGEYEVGLMTPTVNKDEVLDFALKGLLFSQKTTRHIIPARPMFVTVPTDWLKGDLSYDEANNRLRMHLASKRVERLPPGQILDRRYDEELYVFK